MPHPGRTAHFHSTRRSTCPWRFHGRVQFTSVQFSRAIGLDASSLVLCKNRNLRVLARGAGPDLGIRAATEHVDACVSLLNYPAPRRAAIARPFNGAICTKHFSNNPSSHGTRGWSLKQLMCAFLLPLYFTTSYLCGRYSGLRVVKNAPPQNTPIDHGISIYSLHFSRDTYCIVRPHLLQPPSYSKLV